MITTAETTPVGLSIARDTLIDLVRAEIVRSLGVNQTEMIQAVVRAALDAKDERSYGTTRRSFRSRSRR